MKRPSIRVLVVTAVLAVVAAVAAGCATAPPVELIQARTAYDRASFGPAAQLAPADLRKARLALDQAERALSDEKNPAKAVDFAYIAERTVQIAEAHAETALTERKMATQAAGTLTAARAAAGREPSVERRSRRNRSASSARRARPPSKRPMRPNRRPVPPRRRPPRPSRGPQQANDALDRLSAKADARGMVITLSGSVLFRSNGADLLPAALRRLDEVASVLVAQGQNVVVEGYTDSKGSSWSNVDLSRRRAEAVRSYLVSRGCPTDRIVARGMGPDRPVADNASGEGRANNRRVEIVINQP